MRFFHLEEAPPLPRGVWSPPRDLGRHLAALRLRPGEPVLLLTTKDCWRAAWRSDGLLDVLGPAPRPRLELMPMTLATARPKGSRADTLVRRAAESGAGRLLWVSWRRSVAGRGSPTLPRHGRWQRLLREVCQQCRRPDLPEIEAEARSVARTLEVVRGLPVVLRPGAPPLWEVLEATAPAAVTFFVGPEGGMDAEERACLAGSGAREAGLGPMVLRIESAGPAACLLASHWWRLRAGGQSQPRSAKET